MKIITSFLLVLFSLNVQAQKAINVACIDFTFNDKKSKDGKNITYIFETALTKSTPLIKLLERKNLDIVLSKIEEEKNLLSDFGEQAKKDLILAGVDYIVLGNILTPSGYDTATVYIQFTKISGKDVTTKHSISIFINKDDLNNLPKLENEIIKSLKQIPFVENIGLIEKDQLEQINKQFEEKDKRIKELENQEKRRKLDEENLEKNKSILPEIEIDFRFILDSFVIVILSKNFIPVKYQFGISNVSDNALGNLFRLGEQLWYPTQKNPYIVDIYCGISKYQ